VVVTDTKGHPVTDLTKDDFIILDDGQPQPVAFFSPNDNPKPPAPVTMPGPDSYTNSLAASNATPSVTVLLFDTLHTHWVSQGYALHRVRKFLHQIQPQDHIGIYVLSSQLKVVHDFVHDASDLVAAIQRYDERHSHDAQKPVAGVAESTGDLSLDRFLSGKENRYHPDLDGHAGQAGFAKARFEWARQSTAESMEAIARQLSTVPGRKTLIWVTDYLGMMGYFLDRGMDEAARSWRQYSSASTKVPDALASEDNAQVERMLRLMNDSGVTVYPVYAAGLVTDYMPGTWSHPEMDELAKRTGGRAFYNRNDLETGIRRALDETRFSYSLAYYPAHNQWNGKWRELRVKTSRPGLTLLARAGYFAMPDPVLVSPQNRFQFLSEIALSPIESTQLPLRVRMTTSSTPEGPKIDTSVHMDLQTILTRNEDGHWRGNFEIMLMQLDNKNNLLNATSEGVDADLKPEKYETVSREGWDLPIQLNLMPGATLLCVILHDANSSQVGSVRIPLTPAMTR